MDFVHCNICFTPPSSDVNIFYITSCCHLLCGNCENGGSKKCKVCNRACKVMKISSEMPQNIKRIFKGSYKDAMKLLKKVMFHQQNYKLIINKYLPHLEKKYISLKEAFGKQVERQKEVERELKKFQEINKTLSSENEKLKNELWSAMACPPLNSMSSLISSPATPDFSFSFHQALQESQGVTSDLNAWKRKNRPSMIEALRQTRFNTCGIQQSKTTSSGRFNISPSNNNTSSITGCTTPARLNFNKTNPKHYYQTRIPPNTRPSFNF